MTTLDEAQRKAAATYNAAADSFDHPANSFWERFGQRTIERMKLAPGARVLDVCCGSGASAIPAAEAVGPHGHVLGIDLAENLLELARAKTRQRGLTHAEFAIGDMLALGGREPRFDAVVCVFGIFFVPDMAAAVRELWRVLRPGGQLAITNWGPRWLEPASSAFWSSIREVRPDLHKAFNPWDRICDPQALGALLADGGVEHAELVAEAGKHPLPSAEAWWAAVLGSGYRGTLDQLDPAAREQVRRANLDYMRSSGLREAELNVLYAIARKS